MLGPFAGLRPSQDALRCSSLYGVEDVISM